MMVLLIGRSSQVDDVAGLILLLRFNAATVDQHF
jgi:hypothetical protein